jgi:carbamoyltransferase
MSLIGVNFPGREPSACLVAGNELVAAVEEDRFTREKYAEDRLPCASAEFCLRHSGLAPGDIDCIAFPWDVPGYADGSIASMYKQLNAACPPDAEMLRWQEENLRAFHPRNVAHGIETVWRTIAPGTPVPEIRFVPHHYAHACGAFFGSGFEDALVVVADGNGDRECTSIWRGSATGVELLASIPMPHSLGWFYSTVSNFLGFPAGSGEPKVMGLAAYGNENTYARKLAALIALDGDGWRYAVGHEYLYSGKHSFSSEFTDALFDLTQLQPRASGEPVGDRHRDLARAAQAMIEESMLRLVRHWMTKTGLRNLCLNGGVALNCKANGELWRAAGADAIYVPPAASDAGQCIGAAAAVLWDRDRVRLTPIRDADYGPAFDDASIGVALRRSGYPRERPPDLAPVVAEAIESGKIVGWFEGRIEIGPRALGRRSIIADPRSAAIRDRINHIKKREPWRPLCPSILEEHAAEYLERPTAAPFMNLAFYVRSAACQRIAGVVHVDGTTRPHLVNRSLQPAYWNVINAFRQRTGVAAVLNTSFNVDSEPVVLSPEHAVRCFAGSGLDAMAIGGYYVTKARAPITVATPRPAANMVRIPAGTYPIGRRRVPFRLDAFEIARTPVTNTEYERFLAWLDGNGDESVRHPLQPHGKSHVPQQWGDAEWTHASHPVVGVDWWDAWAYTTWMKMRLPTEIEWEAAAAGPNGLRFPWGEEWQPERCNSATSYGDHAWRDGRTTPVDAFPEGASQFGVLDMMGNVWEWTSSAYVGGQLITDPPPYDGDGPVAIRGGSFRRSERFNQCTARCDSEVDVRAPNNGFRLCRSIQ